MKDIFRKRLEMENNQLMQYFHFVSDVVMQPQFSSQRSLPAIWINFTRSIQDYQQQMQISILWKFNPKLGYKGHFPTWKCVNISFPFLHMYYMLKIYKGLCQL